MRFDNIICVALGKKYNIIHHSIYERGLLMKRCVASLLMIGVFFCSEAKAETIFEALGEAYTSNPDLRAQRAYLRSIDENVAMAKSGYRPTITASGGYTDSRKDNDKLQSDEGSESQFIEARINQPIFNGFNTVNSVKSADSFVRSEQYNLYNVEQSVFLNASEAYLNVVRDEAILDLQKNNEQLLKKQLDETTERFNVGELTRTDVAQAHSSYSQAQANRISAEGNLQVSKAIYLQVIGKNPENLVEPDNIHIFLPAEFDRALAYTLDNNYGILQSKKYLESKDYDIKANYGPLLPSAAATAAVAKTKSDPKWSGSKDSTIDSVEFGVNVSIPLYDAGQNRAKIRQSKYAKWQAYENVLSAERSAVANITSYWESMVANDAMIKALLDRVSANEIALDGVKKEETLGNRTILDVLNAYQYLLDSKVEVIKARREYYLSAMRVMQAMGKLTAENLSLDVELYHPKKYYKETRDKWLSTSIDKG
jgi:TolC family type I secretion outer membrane protein